MGYGLSRSSGLSLVVLDGKKSCGDEVVVGGEFPLRGSVLLPSMGKHGQLQRQCDCCRSCNGSLRLEYDVVGGGLRDDAYMLPRAARAYTKNYQIGLLAAWNRDGEVGRGDARQVRRRPRGKAREVSNDVSNDLIHACIQSLSSDFDILWPVPLIQDEPRLQRNMSSNQNSQFPNPLSFQSDFPMSPSFPILQDVLPHCTD
jgi:hypothetical protein